MKKIVLVLLSFISLYATDIKIAVAANVTYALDELILEFNKQYPDIKVQAVISGSGNLTAQIINKAPFSIFLSANMKYPEKLYKSGYAKTKPVVYAKGALSMVSKEQNNIKDGLKSLEDKNISKIAVANPKIAPYGQATIEVLKNAKILDKIKDKFVYGQNISQTLTFVLKVTNIGFIAKSALYSPKLKKIKLFSKDVNKELYSPIKQGMVLLKDSKQTRAFYDFILSKKAKEVFKKYGYSVDE